MIFFRLISYLPLSILYLLSDLVYLIAVYVIGYRKFVVEENIAYAFPQKTPAERLRIKKEFYRNFTDSFAETIKYLTVNKEKLAHMVEVRGWEQVSAKINKGETCIVMSGHFFNWEAHVVGYTSQADHLMEVVYLKIQNPFFEKLIFTMRSRFGGKMIERSDFQRNFLRSRSIPRLVALAADQRPEGVEKRYWSKFLNREAPFFEGAEKLAKKFNLPVFFTSVEKPKRGKYVFTYRLMAEPPYANSLDHSITEAFIASMEENIKNDPANYLWSHKRWKEIKKN